MARDITICDIPHYRDLELNPDPTTISQTDYVNALAKYIRIHLAARNAHGTHPTDPRHQSLLRRYREQDRLRDQALIAILLPPEDPDEVDFRTQFESQYGREQQPEDIPRWPDIPYILPDTDPTTEQIISEYQQNIQTVMLSQPISSTPCDPPSSSPPPQNYIPSTMTPPSKSPTTQANYLPTPPPNLTPTSCQLHRKGLGPLQPRPL